MVEKCDKFPNCQAAEVSKEQKRQYTDLHDKLTEISENLKDFSLRFSDDLKNFSNTISAFSIKLADIKPLAKSLEEFKQINKEDHDNLFERLRKVEKEKSESDDLKKAEATLRTEIANVAREKLETRTKIIFTALTVILFLTGIVLGHFWK